MEPIPISTQQYTAAQQPASSLIPLRQESTAGPIRRETDVSSRSLDEQKAKLRETTQDFEAIFIRQLLKNMRSTLMDGGMFGSGPEGEIYSDMMETALADHIAERGVLGLGEQLYRHMVTRIDPSETENAGNAHIRPKEITAE